MWKLFPKAPARISVKLADGEWEFLLGGGMPWLFVRDYWIKAASAARRVTNPGKTRPPP